MADAERLYCIDSSSLIHLHRAYGPTTGASVWERVSKLIADKRLFAPHYVLEEVDRGDDDLGKRCREFPGLFRQPTEEVANIVGRVITTHENLIKHVKAENQADPWLIAWAIWETSRLQSDLFGGECVVVTQEGSKVGRIGDVASTYQLRCVNLDGMFELEGWSFTLTGPS
ncbi:MAG TPA: DUF4411 family protein [Candidatus Nitrosotalea sp.]|nr:DUF4411 family protein [Candidatus Nitrosotalea sp.]